MKSLLILAMLAFNVLYSLPSFAQQHNDTTSTNSPIIHDKLTLQIYTASVAAKGQLQLDIDYSLEQYSNHFGWRKTTGSLPELKARYGLFKNVEVRIGTRVVYLNRNYMDPMDEFPTQKFLDLFTIGAKVTLASYNNAKGSLAIVAESNAPLLRVPTYLGWRNQFKPTLTIINENQLNSWLGYTLNAGTSYHIWERHAYSLQLAAAALFYHNSHTISFIGFSQIGDPFNSGYSNFSLNTGFVYAATPFLQLRTGFNMNLNGYPTNVADLGGTIGLAWQPDFFKKK